MFILPLTNHLTNEYRIQESATAGFEKPANGVPPWMDAHGLYFLQSKYLLKGETPWDAYVRLSVAAARRLKRPRLANRFFEIMWKGWMGPASPILANLGTERGLPISCLTGDTWLITPNGGVQMQDVQVGDLLLTHKGRYRKVTAKQSRMSSGDLYEIAIGTRMTKTRITGNHPVLTNLGWVRVDELDPKIHFVAVDHELTDYVEEPYVLDMIKYCNYETVEQEGKLYKAAEVTTRKAIKAAEERGGIVTYYAAPPVTAPVTEELAWAIGLWLADGSRTISNKKEPNGIRITVGSDDGEIADKWLDIISRTFNVKGNRYTSESQRENFAGGRKTSWISVNANGKFLGNLFTQEFGDGCFTKTIPQWVIDLPKPQLQALVDGLLLGDGHFRPNGTWQLTLSNPKLLLGLYVICLKLGIQVGCQMLTKYRRGEGCVTKAQQYTMTGLKTDSIVLSPNRANSGIQFGTLRYCPIKHLEKLEQDEEVFDISVEEDNSFSANGVIVHNCNSLHVPDNLVGIFNSNQELAQLSSKGAGVGIYVGDIRARGAKVAGGYISSGVIPWCKVYDATTVSVSQGSTRKGASAFYLPFSHGDIKAFINMRRPSGDENLRCMNTHHAVVFTDADMEAIKKGGEARELFQEIIRTRVETGEPYMMFYDNVNGVNPIGYEELELKVKTSNICSEITAYTDPEHTFVCCLSSMNLAKWEEWKDTKAAYYAIWFLDGVMQEYIDRAKHLPHFDNAVRFAEKSRMLGLGAMGYHTLLQSKLLPFGSFGADLLNRTIFNHIADQTNKASRDMAKEFGEPEWCIGTGTRHTHTQAIAPTVSNSAICGNISPGIEPWAANNFEKKSAVGTLFMHNKQLEQLLEERGQNTSDTWDSITANSGSVQHLDCLTDEEKEVFLTAREINQMDIIRSAAARQKCMDKHRQGQAQSVNLFFTADADETYIAKVHFEAWKQGLKTLYYCRSQSVSSADLPPSTRKAMKQVSSGEAEECTACHG